MIAIDNRGKRVDELIDKRVDWLIEHSSQFIQVNVSFERYEIRVYNVDGNPKNCKWFAYDLLQYKDWKEQFTMMLNFAYLF